jgi:hypothetical protein
MNFRIILKFILNYGFAKMLNLKIENFGPISKADLEIKKINIIGGKNASGKSTAKSTASKILYSLLSSVSNDCNVFLNKYLFNNLNHIYFQLLDKLREYGENNIESEIEISFNTNLGIQNPGIAFNGDISFNSLIEKYMEFTKDNNINDKNLKKELTKLIKRELNSK